MSLLLLLFFRFGLDLSHNFVDGLIRRHLFASDEELELYVISICLNQLLEIIIDGLLVLSISGAKHHLLSNKYAPSDFFHLSALFFFLLIRHFHVR